MAAKNEFGSKHCKSKPNVDCSRAVDTFRAKLAAKKRFDLVKVAIHQDVILLCAEWHQIVILRHTDRIEQ